VVSGAPLGASVVTLVEFIVTLSDDQQQSAATLDAPTDALRLLATPTRAKRMRRVDRNGARRPTTDFDFHRGPRLIASRFTITNVPAVRLGVLLARDYLPLAAWCGGRGAVVSQYSIRTQMRFALSTLRTQGVFSLFPSELRQRKLFGGTEQSSPANGALKV
jgi:hypothetical protein